MKRNPTFHIIFASLVLFVFLFTTLQIYGESKIKYDEVGSNSNSNFPTGLGNSSLSKQTSITDNKGVNSDIDKAVIIMFDRGYKTEFTNAKPILDKYEFKASFFVICSFVDGKGYYELSKGKEFFRDVADEEPMSWDEIKLLRDEGHDVQSHGMEHRYLRNLSFDQIEDEVAGSKQCLDERGLTANFFQVPFNRGADNSTILNIISKHFDFGLSGHSKLMFLNCDGWEHGYKTKSYKYQVDCKPLLDDGTPTRTHKYAIKEWSHDRFHEELNEKNPLLRPHEDEISDMLFNEFVSIVESQNLYNSKAGKIVAIPVIGYHSIDTSRPFDTSVELFDREMRYLNDNGIKVLKFTDLGYDEKENHFYIK